jgi:hypothetical protein
MLAVDEHAAARTDPRAHGCPALPVHRHVHEDAEAVRDRTEPQRRFRRFPREARGIQVGMTPLHCRAVLRDGDSQKAVAGGPSLRLRRYRAAQAPPFPVDSSTPAVAHGAATRKSWMLRAAVVGLLAAGLIAILWSYRRGHTFQAELTRLRESMRVQAAEQNSLQLSLEKEIGKTRAREEELRRDLAAGAHGEVLGVGGELAETRERLATLESDRRAGERIIREYGAGICLIEGSYAFYDDQGRGLRYQLDDAGKPLRRDDGSPALEPGHTGPLYTQDYFGTGFLVDAAWIVLTNHHVAEPWSTDGDAESFAERGFKPRFVLFRAFFPKEAEPFALSVDRISGAADLALVRIDTRGRNIPVIPLDRSGKGAVAGHPVVVLGYPTGIQAVLAKADSNVVKEVVAASGTSSERMTEALASKGLIRPSTTQGHIGDITNTDVVFDASTSQGGSGGPVFNRQGVVIAVEYAVLSKFEGNSFGVPIGYALELLDSSRPKAADE